MNEDDSHKDARGFLESASADLVADYAARGRRFEQLTEEALTSHWVAGFRAVAVNYADPDARRLTADLVAEYTLRGIEPPYRLVKCELDTYTQAAVSIIKQIEQSDPDRFEEIARIFATKLDAFKSKRTKTRS